MNLRFSVGFSRVKILRFAQDDKTAFFLLEALNLFEIPAQCTGFIGARQGDPCQPTGGRGCLYPHLRGGWTGFLPRQGYYIQATGWLPTREPTRGLSSVSWVYPVGVGYLLEILNPSRVCIPMGHLTTGSLRKCYGNPWLVYRTPAGLNKIKKIWLVSRISTVRRCG